MKNKTKVEVIADAHGIRTSDKYEPGMKGYIDGYVQLSDGLNAIVIIDKKFIPVHIRHLKIVKQQ